MSEDKYNEEDQTFIVDVFPLELEHSLSSLSKWEQEFAKPFLSKEEKSTEETLAYVRYMILTPEVPSDITEKLTQKNVNDIMAYIDSKQTATWFNESRPEAKSGETITSELVYYWMTSFQIPWEAQYWHLNRLFTLIKVFDLKQAKPKPMSKAETIARNKELNARRRAEMGSRG
jgi:hypothetical protein